MIAKRKSLIPLKEEAPVVTFASVMDKMINAKDEDSLNVAAGLIGEVADPQQREELSLKYDHLIEVIRS